MSLDEFVKRHYKWSPVEDKEEMLDQVMDCLKDSKRKLKLDVKDNVIHAIIDPEHFVEDLLVSFLAKQFSGYYVVIESERGTFVAGGNISGVLRTRANFKKVINGLGKEISSAI